MFNPKRFLLKAQSFLSNTLYVFAVLNFGLLVFLNSTITPFESLIYTRISIFFLVLFLIVLIIIKGFSMGKFIELLPDILFITIGLSIAGVERVFQFYLIGRQTFRLIRDMALGHFDGKILDKLSENPPVFVLFSFIFTIFIGTLFLMLPIATVSGKVTSLVGALFTSTSATCVTGLIVYNTGTHFTLFGQIVILILLQIGGLGIMTISSAFAVMLGQKLSLRSENLMQNVVNETNKIDMVSLMKHIVIVSFLFEILGSIILYFTFRNEFASTPKAVYHSIFHSISAFCNAGFSLYQDSFVGFRSNLNINFVITTLIIIGGIGFPVLMDIKKNVLERFKLNRLSLHSKIVLVSSFVLILAGTFAFFISEYNSQMKGFSLTERILSSYFQSVTTRTAGFNTIDNAGLSRASAFISNLFMFIGGSPGSTAGGIKTTTFAIVLISVVSMFKGERDVNIFQRKVSETIIRRVLALIAASITLISFIIVLLLLIEPFGFEETLFEAFSAFGTVGLSMGITPHLSMTGRLLIILLMYLGRVGPLTLIFAISESKAKTSFSFTEEKISIG